MFNKEVIICFDVQIILFNATLITGVKANENSGLITGINYILKHIKIENSYFKL